MRHSVCRAVDTYFWIAGKLCAQPVAQAAHSCGAGWQLRSSLFQSQRQRAGKGYGRCAAAVGGSALSAVDEGRQCQPQPLYQHTDAVEPVKLMAVRLMVSMPSNCTGIFPTACVASTWKWQLGYAFKSSAISAMGCTTPNSLSTQSQQPERCPGAAAFSGLQGLLCRPAGCPAAPPRTPAFAVPPDCR